LLARINSLKLLFLLKLLLTVEQVDLVKEETQWESMNLQLIRVSLKKHAKTMKLKIPIASTAVPSNNARIAFLHHQNLVKMENAQQLKTLRNGKFLNTEALQEPML